MTQARGIFDYYDDMERLDSPVQEKVLSALEAFDPNAYGVHDVDRAIDADYLRPHDFAALLSPAAEERLGDMAARARLERERYFGNSVFIFSPLYIANYCSNRCTYCGFHAGADMQRAMLTPEEIDREMSAMEATGLEEVLILTGESPKHSSLDYISQACSMAKTHFRNVGIEVYPVNTEDYRTLHEAGADFVTVFQETYITENYGKYHPGGRKRVFPYRFDAQERALRGGMRGVGFSALFGLSEWRRDAFATGLHAWHLQRAYPHAEISLSCPRIRPIEGKESIEYRHVTERELFQALLAYRIFMPFAGITVSTRERAGFRDNAMRICATKISAGVKTDVGQHAKDLQDRGSSQFDISDPRSLSQVCCDLDAAGMQPVLNDYVYAG